jgi:hypothetical protein
MLLLLLGFLMIGLSVRFRSGRKAAVQTENVSVPSTDRLGKTVPA